MQPVTPRFLSALRNSHRVVVQVDAYLDGDPVGQQLPIVGGSVTIDRISGVRRQLTVQIPDIAILPTLGAQLTPYGIELVVQRGIDYGDGVTELVPLGTFRLDVGTTTQASPTGYTGPDRAKALIDARFTGPRQASAIDAVAMIEALAVEVLPDVVVTNVDVTNPEDDSTTLPVIPQVIWDRERWDAMTSLAASLGAELYFSASGELLVARTPSITNPPVWTVDQGAHGVLIDFTRELSREDTFNGVVASGERADGMYPARAVALDDDPDSPTRWGGPFGQVTYFFESPLIHTPNGAARVAEALLSDKVALSRSVRLTCVPNPALDVGDVIAVRMPNGVDERHLIDRLTIPLDATSPMQIDTRTPSAAIVIVDPAPPLPDIDVPPPYVPPVLPPIDLPKPVPPPKLPKPPGGPHGPYIPGKPPPPGGPPTDPLRPDGIPVIPPVGGTDPNKPVQATGTFVLEGTALQAFRHHGVALPQHVWGPGGNSYAYVALEPWGWAGAPYHSNVRYTVNVHTGDDRGLTFAVRVRGDDNYADGYWKVVHSAFFPEGYYDLTRQEFTEPSGSLFVDRFGIYDDIITTGTTESWAPAPRHGSMGFGVHRTDRNDITNALCRFTVYDLDESATDKPAKLYIVGGDSRNLTTPLNSTTLDLGTEPFGGNPWNVGLTLAADVTASSLWIKVWTGPGQTGTLLGTWTQTLNVSGGAHVGYDPQFWQWVEFPHHYAQKVSGPTNNGGEGYLGIDTFGSEYAGDDATGVNATTGALIKTTAAPGDHEWSYATRIRGVGFEIGGGYWKPTAVTETIDTTNPSPVVDGVTLHEPDPRGPSWLDAIGIFDSARDGGSAHNTHRPNSRIDLPPQDWWVRRGWYVVYSNGDLAPSPGFPEEGPIAPASDVIFDPEQRGEDAQLIYVSGSGEPVWGIGASYENKYINSDGDPIPVRDSGGVGYGYPRGGQINYGNWATILDVALGGDASASFDKTSVTMPLVAHGETVPLVLAPPQQKNPVGGIKPGDSGDELFFLPYKPIRTKPEAVVQLNYHVAKSTTYIVNYEDGSLTVLPSMGGKEGDVVTIVYYHDPAPIVIDPIPSNPQPVVIPP